MSLSSQLLEWFDQNQRPLPWRKDYRPYDVWISEIMLQQTQMSTVLPYYERWMKLFPDLPTLAGSDLKQVLKAWEGLGYYSRVRNLHESAKLILEKYDGIFPDDFDKIHDLKGIGRYSAGAIASIAFNQEKPIVDGNVLRVLSRVYAIKKPIDVEKNKPLFWKLEEKLIPKGKARWFNQALMELGALVCATENPACAVCPIQKHCQAHKNGDPENYPVRARQKKTVKITAAALVLKKQNRYLIHHRPLGEIMGGLWEFPEWKLSKNKSLTLELVRKKTQRLAQKNFPVSSPDLKYLGLIKRNYTYFNELLHVFWLPVTGGTETGRPNTHGVNASYTSTNWGCRSDRPRNRTSKDTANNAWPSVWASKKDFSKYPFSSAHAKIAKLIQEKTA